MDRFEYFPSCVYRDERPDWVGYTQQIVQNYHTDLSEHAGIDQTHQMIADPALKFLTDYLVLAADTILRDQGYAMDKYEMYLSGLWGQRIKRFGGTDVHVHKNSQICGWFFLQVPPGSSYPVYHDPRANKQMVELDYPMEKTISNATSSINFDSIVPGTILFANSWMRHELTPHNSDSPTSALHFTISHKEIACNTQ
jgi:uncharacterized protein (TIGR02466 family)